MHSESVECQSGSKPLDLLVAHAEHDQVLVAAQAHVRPPFEEEVKSTSQ
jgi:hypothetical protein